MPRNQFGQMIPTFGEGQGQLYEKQTYDAVCRGINVARPTDLLEEGFFPFLQNVRQYIKGELRTRPGLTKLFDLTDCHSFTRLNDPVSNDYRYILAAVDKLYSAKVQGDLTTILANGLSGKPLTMVSARPLRTPRPWMHIADENIMLAADSTGRARNWGITAPLVPPIVSAPSKPNILPISDFLSTTESGIAWNASVGAGIIARVDRLNATITAIKYDTGTIGYCLIQPNTFGTEIQIGQRIRVGSGGTQEFTVVEAILPGIDATTIEGIYYEAGTTGECTVQLTNPTFGLQPNSLLYFNATEYIRVLSVVDGPDGRPAFRCVTTGAFTATNPVVGVNAFRCHLANTHTATESLFCSAFNSSIDPTVGTPKGVGNIRHNFGRNLASNNSIPFTIDDEIHIDLYVDNLSNVTEGRIWFDVDPGTAPGVYAADDLSKNYYFHAFTPSDLQQAADYANAQTYIGATSNRIQRQQLDRFNAVESGATTAALSGQHFRDPVTGEQISADELRARVSRFRQIAEHGGFAAGAGRIGLRLYEAGGIGSDGAFQVGSGKAQWFPLRIKIADLQRIGEDKTRTLKDVTSVMVNFTVTATTVVGISSWWIGGQQGPDASAASINSETQNTAYYYCYTGENEETGDESNPSPACRAGVFSRRQQNTVALAQHPDPQVTRLNVYRYGGSLLQWLYAGSTPNTTTPSFVDKLTDDSLTNARPLSFEKFRPFPQVGVPTSGVCNVVGNRVVRVSGDRFDNGYAPGTQVLLNGRAYNLYNSPETVSGVDRLEITESAGTLLNATFSFPNPLIINKPLPYVWGPYGQGELGLLILGCGDPLNPNVLYWTNPGDPGSTTDRNQLEVCGPDEPLMMGCVFDAKNYVFSSQRMYLVTPITLADGRLGFRSDPIDNSEGLYSPYGLAVGQLMYSVSKDGINASNGGQSTSITDAALLPLFPHDGIVGEDCVREKLPAPSYADGDLVYQRLAVYGSTLYFDYRRKGDIGLPPATYSLVLDIQTTSWFADLYSDNGVRFHYGQPGKNNYGVIAVTRNKICVLGGETDDTDPIPVIIREPAFNAGDPRSRKRFGDFQVELENGDSPAQIRPYVDNYSASLDLLVAPASSGRQYVTYDFQQFETLYRNLGVEVVHSSNVGATFKYFRWQPNAAAKPFDTVLRATDWDTMGSPGEKFVQGFVLEFDTGGVDQQIAVDIDGAVVHEALFVNHNGQGSKSYSLEAPAITHNARIRPLDGVGCRIFNVTWIATPFPEASKVWQTTQHDFGICGYKHIPEGWIELLSTANVTFSIYVNGVQHAYQILNQNGRQERKYLRFGPHKGRLFSFRVESSEPVRVFSSSCVHVGAWGRGAEEQYKVVHPFGGPNGEEQGAMV